MDKNGKSKRNTIYDRVLNGVERAGNKLPHPITLFAILALAIVIISAICEMLGVSAISETINKETGEIEYTTVAIKSLLSGEGITYIIKNAITNFTSFAPLGVVLVGMLGIGCAEGSGYISTLIKKLVSKTPAKLVTPTVVFLGVMSNIASDAGYLVLIPIGAIIFMTYNRHPMAGLSAAFAGVSGGFSANLLIGSTDTMLSGISTASAQIIDPTYNVDPTSNWFFMIASTFMIVLLGTIITDRIVEPRLGNFKNTGEDVNTATKLSKEEEKALKWANITLVALIAAIVIWAIPQNSLLRNQETGSLIYRSLLIEGIVVFITILFLVPSIVYGRVAGKYKNEKDVCEQLVKNMSSMGSYIALAFVASQFIAYFNESKLGTVIALKGAQFLQNVNLPGSVLMVIFIVITAILNIFMGSASAKWTIVAPVFIPMFMQLGYSPELTQVAYRIGDSSTNIISPLMSYFPMIIIFAKKYDKDSGIGTIISTMIPYSFIFLIGWSLLLVVWMLLGLPLGPGVTI